MGKFLSSYIGKTVLTINGDRLGEISNLTFDAKIKTAKNLVIFNDEQDEYQLPLNSIFCHGEDVVIMKSFLKKPIVNTVISPLRLKCYDLFGKYLGVVNDIIFESDDKTVNSVLVGQSEFNPLNIASCGKDAVFFDFSEKPIKVPRRKTLIIGSEDIEKFYEKAKKHSALSETTESLPDSSLNADFNANDIKGTLPLRPHNLVIGAKLLMGRKLKKDIYDKLGNLIIKNGTIITLPIVNLALTNGKLFELTVNSLGNLQN